MTENKFHVIGNYFGVTIVCYILLFAFYDQILTHELPCPLCLLQRTAFVGIGLCAFMNIKEGIKPSHYGFMLLASLLGFMIALRQIFLHIAPDDPGYGPVFFGLHYYVWSAISFVFAVGFIGIALLLERGFIPKARPIGKPTYALGIILLGLILANGISTVLECGLMVCPDNPVKYDVLSEHKTSSLG
ncbi:disulfide bond formation protein B [Legionella yabuuchiae]|uniref:disulfide bond formation protein B n=1 Tax=Legionella yabuuchiae TaxID=376727 RepID=UPI0010568AF2|nr:disulfide bond formation protein B [Legionella yabuuchiae]